MEKYHQEVEIKPVTHQPAFSELDLIMLEGILGQTTILVLSGKGKRDLGPWAGTHTREEGTRRNVPVMKPETKGVVRRMTPGGEMTARK